MTLGMIIPSIMIPTKTPTNLPQYHLLWYLGILHPLLHCLPSLPHNLFHHNRPIISDEHLMEEVADYTTRESKDIIVLSGTVRSHLTFIELILAARKSNIVSV